jgi:hypothetical protein
MPRSAIDPVRSTVEYEVYDRLRAAGREATFRNVFCGRSVSDVVGHVGLDRFGGVWRT